ncbi:MAG: MBL fold metallo-hydrolase RNA specificity domain-containing protein [Victivallales bacterium]
MLDYFRNAKVDCVCKHTSGHASMDDISNFIKALRPAKMIPIHTQSKEPFKECFGSQILDLKNGETVIPISQ